MRVLQVVSSSLDTEARTQVALVSDRLRELGYDLQTIVSSVSGWSDPLSWEALHRSRSPQAEGPITLHFHGTVRRRDIQILKRIKVSCFVFSVYPGDPLVRDPLPYSLWNGSLKWLERHADAGVVCAESLALEARRRGAWEKDFWRVIPPAFELEKFRRVKNRPGRLRALLGIGEDEFIVGIPDGLPSREEEDEWVSVFVRTRKDRPEIRYLIPASDEGRTRGFLERVEKEELVGQLFLLQAPFEWEEFYADINVVFSLSRKVTLPRRLIEGLAAGVPVSAPDVGVNTELLNTAEWTSGTFQAGNLEQIVPGFYFALENRTAFDRYTRELKDCVIRRYDPAAVARQIEDLYRSMVATRSLDGETR